jgi:hypothetical protein
MSTDQPTESPTPTPTCPKCQGEMWDNRESKRNPKAPDFKCKDKSCDGVIWPPRDANAPKTTTPAGTADDPACPVCGGKMWDDRASKRNPRAPDFKCRNKPKYQGAPGCPGVIWPPRDGERRSATASAASRSGPATRQADDRSGSPRSAPPAPPPPPTDRDYPADLDDELPF